MYASLKHLYLHIFSLCTRLFSFIHNGGYGRLTVFLSGNIGRKMSFRKCVIIKSKLFEVIRDGRYVNFIKKGWKVVKNMSLGLETVG